MAIEIPQRIVVVSGLSMMFPTSHIMIYRMLDLKPYLDAIAIAATNTYSLIAFALVILALISVRVLYARTRAHSQLREVDRLRGFELLLGHPPAERGLSQTQLARYYRSRMLFILALTIVMWLGVISLVAVRKHDEPLDPLDRQATYTVNVFSTPPGAIVVCDGEWKGITPCAIRIKKGIHQCTLTKEGFRTIDRLLEVPRLGPLSLALEQQ